MNDTKYVAGFLFHCEHVLLVRKLSPKWQRGLLNGIGGKVEVNENYHDAMKREFREETGLIIPEWQVYAHERGPGYNVMFYRASIPDTVSTPRTPEKNDRSEELEWVLKDSLPREVMVGNLQWLIPMALDPRDLMVSITTPDDIKEKPRW